MMVTTQFFAMKIARYLHEHDISPDVLGAVAEKAFGNGALNATPGGASRCPPRPSPTSMMLNPPLTQYMFCSPGEGAVAVVLCRDDLASPYTAPRSGCGRSPCAPAATARSRCWSPHLAAERASARPPTPRPPRSPRPASARTRCRSPRLQDTEAGAEVMHMAETGLCKHGDQEALIPDGATEIGGSPADQHRRRPDRQRRADRRVRPAPGPRDRACSCRGDAGARQVPGDPTVGFTQVYGAPGVSACTVLTR